MTALVSFERVFEVLDLKPMVMEAADARVLPEGPLSVSFEDVRFHYPTASEVSLASWSQSPARTPWPWDRTCFAGSRSRRRRAP